MIIDDAFKASQVLSVLDGVRHPVKGAKIEYKGLVVTAQLYISDKKEEKIYLTATTLYGDATTHVLQKELQADVPSDNFQPSGMQKLILSDKWEPL